MQYKYTISAKYTQTNKCTVRKNMWKKVWKKPMQRIVMQYHVNSKIFPTIIVLIQVNQLTGKV